MNGKKPTFGSVCDGIGCGHLAFEREGYDCLWSAEIDAFPSAVLKERFPHVRNVGNMKKIRGKLKEAFIKAPDVLTGGTPCFVPGTMVLCKEGYKPIEDIQPGDYVVTHLGRLQKVVTIGSKRAEVGRLDGIGLPEGLVCTEEHPFLSCEWKSQNTRRNNKYFRNVTTSDLEWTAAKDMPGRQWLSLATIPPEWIEYEGSNVFNALEKMYIAGMYVGDGYIRRWKGKNKKAVILCLNDEKIARLRSHIRPDIKLCVVPQRTSKKVTICDTKLAEWLSENFGELSYKKTLPAWVATNSSEYGKELLQGVIDTDGCVKTQNCTSVTTVSESLAYGLASLMNLHGFVASVEKCIRPKTCIIEGRMVNQRDTYAVRGWKSQSSVKSRMCHDYLARKVKSYTKLGEDLVCNIEVEEDHSYIANGIIVHNCQAFSIAGKRKGLDDERGNLSLEFCRIADGIDAVRFAAGKDGCVVLWENVPGVLSDKGNAFGCFLGMLAGEDEAIDVKKWPRAGVVCGTRRRVAWCILDSQYFGVAQRRRRVFVVAVPNQLIERLGERADPAEILSIGYGSRGHTPSRGKAREGVAGDAGKRVEGSHWDGSGVHPTLNQSNNDGGIGASNQEVFSQRGAGLVKWPADVACTLNAHFGDKQGLEDQHALNGASLFVPAQALYENHANDSRVTGPHDVSPMLTARMGTGGGNVPLVGPGETIAIADVVHGDKACNGKGWNDDGSAYTMDTMATQGVCVGAFKGGQGAKAGSIGFSEHVSPTLSSADSGSNRVPVVAQGVCTAIAINTKQQSQNIGMDVANSIGANDYKEPQAVMHTSTVRRLLVTECEILQGLPRGWTLIPWRGKPASECPDGPRYKGIGNGQTVQVMQWLAMRIRNAITE